MHWQNRLFLTFESLTLHLIFLDSVKQCYLQTKTHAVTSSGGAQSITWYKQKRRRNRWASKQVSAFTSGTFTPFVSVRLSLWCNLTPATWHLIPSHAVLHLFHRFRCRPLPAPLALHHLSQFFYRCHARHNSIWFDCYSNANLERL